MTRKALTNMNDVRETMLSILYTHYVAKGKDLYFKSRSVSKDTDVSQWILCHTCMELEKDGVVSRHGSNPIKWRTHFNELKR